MDNAQKAIMIGVGLFITIILITAVMAITGIGTSLLDSGQSQLAGLSSTLTSQLTASFDEKTMTGAQVYAYCQQYYDSMDLVVCVNNIATGGTVYWISYYEGTGYDASEHTVTATADNTSSPITLVKLSSSSTTSERIVTTATYKSSLITQNEMVVGIAFERQ